MRISSSSVRGRGGELGMQRLCWTLALHKVARGERSGPHGAAERDPSLTNPDSVVWVRMLKDLKHLMTPCYITDDVS